MASTESMAPMIQGVIWVITAFSLIMANVRFYIKWKYRGKLWFDDYILLSAAHRHVPAGPVGGRPSLDYARADQLCDHATPVGDDQREAICVVCDSLAGGGGHTSRHSPFRLVYTLRENLRPFYPWNLHWPGRGTRLRPVEKVGASLAMSLGILSGVVTIVKATYTNQIVDNDWTYSSADLFIWNVVEPASVIIAASLPNLRVFVIKNSRHLKASIRIGSSSALGMRGRSRRTDDVSLENVHNTIKAISAGTDRRRGEGRTWITSRERGDGESEKSIYYATGDLPRLAIVQTSTFAVEYPEEPSPTLSPRKDR
ncbi:hypothetical protein NPX13_g8704 [Xylaria arbuscula]|uniref:Rhodopsin domain-containing protein n=1 Tax=Xylaria arbuscula TaxID=114810 RepID=A0A9W8TJ76_9PEZI|nr:hypothetical protein NPX13_g8704 [Xylaria arbuscula]